MLAQMKIKYGFLKAYILAELIGNPPQKSMFTERLWLKLMDKDILVTKKIVEQKLKITEQ